ncbi:MAG: hypothetical protein H6Q14_1783 [Bacteroidetes bacterium]|nr:hypothetical protein [Bacteroidota bacterium]
MKNVKAYIDEFGNSGLDFDNLQNSTHFIVTAIIVDTESIPKINEDLEKIRVINFQQGEIKSSKVGDNDSRRIRILKEICSLDFTIYAVIVDKRQLYSEGFRYKKSFYKFIHSLVDRELYKTFPNLEIIADEHGGNSFMTEFIEYIRKNHIPDLFNQSSFRFSNSKDLSIIQIADFISGTLARCYDETKISDSKETFLSIISDKVINIKLWPNNYKPYTYDPKDFKDFSPVISELGINLAQQYIDKKSGSREPMILDQIVCLQYLMFYFKNINPTYYVPTFELINRVTKVRMSKMISMHYFRSKIIGPLRDNGVIIASCSKGYKLPSCESDLYDFLNHSNSIIVPMISRIDKARQAVLLATQKEIDILDKSEYQNLKNLINN